MNDPTNPQDSTTPAPAPAPASTGPTLAQPAPTSAPANAGPSLAQPAPTPAAAPTTSAPAQPGPAPAQPASATPPSSGVDPSSIDAAARAAQANRAARERPQPVGPTPAAARNPSADPATDPATDPASRMRTGPGRVDSSSPGPGSGGSGGGGDEGKGKKDAPPPAPPQTGDFNARVRFSRNSRTGDYDGDITGSGERSSTADHAKVIGDITAKAVEGEWALAAAIATGKWEFLKSLCNFWAIGFFLAIVAAIFIISRLASNDAYREIDSARQTSRQVRSALGLEPRAQPLTRRPRRGSDEFPTWNDDAPVVHPQDRVAPYR